MNSHVTKRRLAVGTTPSHPPPISLSLYIYIDLLRSSAAAAATAAFLFQIFFFLGSDRIGSHQIELELKIKPKISSDLFGSDPIVRLPAAESRR
jgi:hypothetical protein